MIEIFRLKRGDLAVQEITRRIERFKGGLILGLGALAWATIKIYDLKTKKYILKKLDGPLEVGNLTATIAKLPDGKMGIHPHITLSNIKFETFCGHLEEAEVAATLELIIIESESKIERYFDQEIGLNLIKD